MKSIHERAEIGDAIDKTTGCAYSLRLNDLDELHDMLKSYPDFGTAFMKVVGDAYSAGFYAGISCAINRGFSKKNDPRKTASQKTEVSA